MCCSQKAQAGQSIVEPQPSSAATQSTRSPAAAAFHGAASDGSRRTSIMCRHGPKPSCSSAPFWDIVPVRP